MAPLTYDGAICYDLLCPNVSVLRTITCCPLRSNCFHSLQHYYETVRLLINHWSSSKFYPFQFPYPHRNLSDLPGMHKLHCTLATPYDPDGIYYISLNDLIYAACYNNHYIGFRTKYTFRGSTASHFRIAALVLHYLRLNLTSRLRLQGYVLTAC